MRDFFQSIYQKPELSNMAQKVVYTIWLLFTLFFTLSSVGTVWENLVDKRIIDDWSMFWFGAVGIVVSTFLKNVLLEVWH